MIGLVNSVSRGRILAGMFDYLDEDSRRWERFDKWARVASNAPFGVIELIQRSNSKSYAFKYVNDDPSNPVRGFQTVTAFGVLSEVHNGYPIFLAEKTLLTGLRTAVGEYVLAHEGSGHGLVACLILKDFLRCLVADLQYAGVEVEEIHPECGNGQVEVSVGRTDRVAAVGRAVLARLIAVRTALQRGYRASFAPIAAADAIGNGTHVHLSATKNGLSVFSSGYRGSGIADDGVHITGGLCGAFAVSTTLFAASTLGCKSLAAGKWSGAWFSSVGYMRIGAPRCCSSRGRRAFARGQPNANPRLSIRPETPAWWLQVSPRSRHTE